MGGAGDGMERVAAAICRLHAGLEHRRCLLGWRHMDGRAAPVGLGNSGEVEEERAGVEAIWIAAGGGGD